MRISDWSSDVCSSDLGRAQPGPGRAVARLIDRGAAGGQMDTRPIRVAQAMLVISLVAAGQRGGALFERQIRCGLPVLAVANVADDARHVGHGVAAGRSEESRVGKECVRKVRARRSPNTLKKNNSKDK